MKILTNDSLFQLKKLFKEDVDIVNKPFNEIVEQNKLVLIDRYVLDENIKLVETGDQEKNDYTNSGLIFQSLKNLSPADATDERLWTTLCFNQYKSYILKRWPDISNGKHFFCEGNRSLTRDNGTARLWWMQFNLKKRSRRAFPKLLRAQCHAICTQTCFAPDWAWSWLCGLALSK